MKLLLFRQVDSQVIRELVPLDLVVSLVRAQAASAAIAELLVLRASVVSPVQQVHQQQLMPQMIMQQQHYIRSWSQAQVTKQQRSTQAQPRYTTMQVLAHLILRYLIH